jgi:thiol-disulfide isomerase/thioredoxin
MLGERLTVVNVWGTWCPSCSRDLPVLASLHGRYRDRGVAFLGISVDEDLGELNAFLADHPTGYPVVMGGAVASQRLRVSSVPTTLFVDDQGKPVDRVVGPLNEDQLARRLDKLLGTPAPVASATPATAGCAGCACAASRPELSVVEDMPTRSWSEDFARAGTLRGSGTYRGKEAWHFESFSIAKLQPSRTAVARLGGRTPVLRFVERTPGLAKAPEGRQPPWVPTAGAVSFTGWVEAKFADVLVEGVVNAARDPAGAKSRQGLLARWDRHHNFYWLYVDFSAGKLAIAKQTVGSPVAVPFPTSEIAIPGFANKASYRLAFEVVGNRLKGRVYGDAGDLLAETPEVTDDKPHVCGISGVNAELSLADPFAPLTGSFARVSASEVTAPPARAGQR